MDQTILRGIYGYGFEEPSPIQKKAIKPIFSGRDVIAQAQSGTGKTATFAIGALNKIDLKKNAVQVLILAPTKELASQTAEVVRALGSMMDGLLVQESYGGCNAGFGKNTNTGNFGNDAPHIICGCPGKVFDMVQRNKISTDHVEMVVLDEADVLLTGDFYEQIFGIFNRFYDNTQVVLVSATLPVEINHMVNKLVRNPIRVEVKAEMLTLQGISQYYVLVESDDQKFETLKHVFEYISLSQCIIYCNSVRRVEDLYNAMDKEGFPVCAIHSKMEKEQRAASFDEFKSGAKRVLISSDITSRGIDVQQVRTVINFDVPHDIHNYLHRIGRSGRWGRKGVGINFVTKYDTQKVHEIESHYKTQMVEMPSNMASL
jgi:superfamily II DNA/RNA helicase